MVGSVSPDTSVPKLLKWQDQHLPLVCWERKILTIQAVTFSQLSVWNSKKIIYFYFVFYEHWCFTCMYVCLCEGVGSLEL